MMLDLDDLVEQPVLKVDNDQTSRFLLLDLDHAFEQPKDLSEGELHLVYLADEDLLVLRTVAVDLPADHELQKL